MNRTVYVNGEYLPETEAKVSIFDRGFLMADAVYEVTSVLGGKLIDFDGHIVRLQRSLDELEINNPYTREEWLNIHRELVQSNDLVDGGIYLQISRGAPNDRDFVWPDPEMTAPTVVLFTQSKPGLANSPSAQAGIKVISIEDIRWGRRDIITRALSNNILHGITRAAVLRFADEAQMKIEERNFTIEEAQQADEAFITSASAFVTPVVELDGQKISSGAPGSIVPRLREIYLEESMKTAI